MKKAIVIGATSGLGKELAKILVDNDYKVGITGRRPELLTELKRYKPEMLLSKAFDVGDAEISVSRLAELVAEIGGLDLLVFSAGTGELNPTLDFAIESDTIRTNVIGFTSIADWTFNYFCQQKQGHFVAISSIGGLRGSRQGPAYNATKGYQINYLEALRQKATFLKLPITITDIRPGFVDTAMAKGDGKFWVAPVDKAARQILNAIIRQQSIVYITKRWLLVAYLLKSLPPFIYNRM